jgi:site-specific DNA-methyltransferase (adenine-specific)/adenine-specific DNA-methyltransferase
MTDSVRLTWAGKRPARVPDPVPALNLVGPAITSENRLIAGDNLAVMAALRPEFAGKLALIYLDPPFFTGKEWRAREPAPIQNPKSKIQNQTGFSDDWSGGMSAYLEWLFDRLSLAYSLLAPDGSIYLHLSWHSVHYAKLLMDEIFGVEQFQNEIVWCYREAINSKKRWNRKHDTLLFYSKGESFTFNCDTAREPYSETTLKKFRSRDAQGPYRLMGRGITDSPLRSKRDLAPEMETLFPELTYRHYLGEGTLPVDYWQIDIENQASKTRTGYPTQKPEALLERILLASSNEGDLVADFCCGSGTTLAVADRLGRRWIGCDAGSHAIDTSAKRLSRQGASFERWRAGE